MSEDKKLTRLKRKIDRLIAKCDKKGYEFNDFEISTIKRIAHAESMDDLNYLVSISIQMIFDEHKVR
ncbi:hypothetical protein P8917_01050 [Bacillus atrophaeus]|uniref:hypothetical protein n=1 Tax=Bacillus atrophaeus TaxID=1452 RepID=UPI0022821484|nr:hypothetical protein [Bacillus atrophaeus]MCY8813652.1 hypothetical protein [Bacillus atrophaeus]MCY8820275.1 hypothetical protein [Bacillus atrophaeus]MCY8828601.1 hypothetical protein [Bacillus atrophaeus]MCY8832688.1 hypothetical protein [Bacillus atrophaeus]MCY8958212.1 hypothetical protein [Bacillus atrophaeus]